MKFMKKLVALALIAVSLFAIALPAMAASTTGTFNTGAVNLRPSMGSSKTYGMVSKGATCDILDNRTDSNGRAWYQVKITSHTKNDPDLYGKTGWCWKQYITVTGGETPSAYPQTQAEAFGTTTLKRGSTGNYVRNLQLCLYVMGNLPTWGDIDGVFGVNTESGVYEYQLAHMDELGGEDGVDGMVGKNTKALLWKTYGAMLKDQGYK